ncbi:hypothetical protein V8V91_13000 [Algoriphagus halophilus]
MTLLVEQIKAALEDKAIPEKAAFFRDFSNLDLVNMGKEINSWG